MTLTVSLILLLFLTLAREGIAAPTAATLRAQIRAQVRDVEQATTTIRFFHHHAFLLTRKQTRRVAEREVHAAQARIDRGRTRLASLRAALKDAQPIPHLAAWLCIHAGEGSWTASTDNGYYGGLQMDMEFQQTYAPWLLRAKGTADHWTPREQMLTAERAWRTRGFWPWPTTARNCGLLG